MKTYHYVYKLVWKDDPQYYYIGVHSTSRTPENDGYYGSGRTVKKFRDLFGKDCFSKTILQECNTREEALQLEFEMVGDCWKKDPFCLNQVQGGANSGKFDNKGKIILHLGNIQEKFVERSHISNFLEKGWELGRMPKTLEKFQNRFKGYVTLHKGDIMQRVSIEEVESLKESGWKLGQSKQLLEEKRDRQKGTVTISSGSLEKHVKPEEVSNYVGWELGRSEKAKNSVSLRRRGCVWVTDGKDDRQVSVKDLEEWIERGWNRGQSESRRNKIGSKSRGNTATRGRVGISKDGVEKKVKPEDLQNYLDQGWVKGRTGKTQESFKVS